ncbi:MAG TPA: hypothetical protein DCX54_05365 [Flavobacteriales bacterium]|nr:hypothetical protein [Flavobacteriales bacterium]
MFLKRSSVIVFLLIQVSVFSTNLTPLDFRLSFQKAIENEGLCVKFIGELETIKNDAYVYRAYRAVAVMSLSKFTTSPAEKLYYFYKGKSELELAIKNTPDNAELRFLRLAAQDFIPGFLLYDNQEEDLAFLLRNLDKIDETFYVREVKNYLVHMGHIKKNNQLSMR